MMNVGDRVLCVKDYSGVFINSKAETYGWEFFEGESYVISDLYNYGSIDAEPEDFWVQLDGKYIVDDYWNISEPIFKQHFEWDIKKIRKIKLDEINRT